MGIKMLTNYLRYFLICFCFVPGAVFAAMPVNPAYVSSSGTGEFCTIEQPCSLSYANANAVAGDTVYLRGGTYIISGTLAAAIKPTHSGSEGNVIAYEAYADETPLFVSASPSTDMLGIYLWGDSYIKIKGLHFQDFFRWAFISNMSHHNEISNCNFYNTSESGTTGVSINGMCSGGGYTCHSTHNWIHNNEIHHGGISGCNEGSDLVKIGSTNTGDQESNYNTIENNVIYSAGHTLSDDFGKYNVWRNNIGHNEGWKVANVIYGTSTGGSTSSLVDESKDFVSEGVSVGNYVFSFTQLTKRGTITSISTTTNSNDTLNYTYDASAFGSPTFSGGLQYVIGQCHYAPDPIGSNPGNGKYGHRCFAMTGYNSDEYRDNLFEGNRAGHSSANPNNNGSDGFTLGSPGNIVRYNVLFGSDGPGLNLKSYGTESYSGSRNKIYNNTIYKNGQYVVGNSNPMIKLGLEQFNLYSRYNQIKNNLFYLNGPSPYVDLGGPAFTYSDQTWERNWCTNQVDGCTVRSGDPLFVNPDMSDMTSTILPDLNLQKTSPAIDGGTYLTRANGAGTNSTALIVDDNGSRYFQDGTWGSDLVRAAETMHADWIAIGTVDNVVQISSIDYSTDTINLASPMTWADDAPIWLYKKSDGEIVLSGSAPDYGAHEYQQLYKNHGSPKSMMSRPPS